MSEKNLALYGMRGYLIDCHRADLPEVSFEGFSYEEVVQQLKDMHIDHVMVYSKDHWGLAWYPTEVGFQHPKMKKLDLDYTGEMVRAAREAGIGVVIYHSVGIDDRAVATHPDWVVVDQWGHKMKVGLPGYLWYRADVASPFGDYVITMLEEILQKYQPDGLFLDGFPPELGFGKHTQELYRRITGKDMPVGEEANKQWLHLQEFEENEIWLPFTRRVRAAIDTYSPNTLLTTNGCNAGMPQSLLDLMDYQFAEPWAGNHYSGAFVSSLMKSPQIGPGDLGLVYDTMPSEKIAQELIAIGMNGARPFLYSESMDRDGGLIDHEVERIADAFAEVEKVQEFWQGKPTSNIALMFSGRSHQVAPDRKEFAHKWSRESRHRDALHAAMTICSDGHLPYRCLNGDDATTWTLKNNDLVVIPCAEVLPESSYEQLISFVKNGGRVLMTLSRMPANIDCSFHHSKAFETLFGVTLEGTDTSFTANDYSVYADFRDYDGVPAFLRKHPVGVAGNRLKVSCTTGKAVGRYLEPISENDLDGRRFWAWKPPVPGKHTAKSVPAVINQLGNGSAMLITFDAFTMCEQFALCQGTTRCHWTNMWLKDLLDSLSRRDVDVQGLPYGAILSLLEQDDSVTVHILNPKCTKGTTSRLTVKAKGFTALEQVYPTAVSCNGKQEDGKLIAETTLSDVPYTVLRLTRKV